MKLSHTITKYYLIEITNLHSDLVSGGNFFADVELFIRMFEQVGNEKINSLLEFQVNKARETNQTQPADIFIREKYLNRKFINTNELDLTGNFIDELNRLVDNSVTGLSLSMTVYYNFLGASLMNNASVLLEKALAHQRRLQAVYLLFQEQTPEFIGEVSQIIDMKSLKRTQIYLKLTHTNEILLIYPNNRIEVIKCQTVIRIFSLVNNGRIIEIKWLNRSNRSIISTFIEFFNPNEKQIWLKRLFAKLVDRQLDINSRNLIDWCHIDSMGFLNQGRNENSNKETTRTFLVLLETLESQIEKFFKKAIILINVEDENNSNKKEMRKIFFGYCF